MKHLLLLAFLFNALVSSSQDQTTQAEEIAKALLEIYPGVSVAVGKGNDVAWAQGFGLADAASGKEVNETTKFRYYSLSKSVTGMALAKLVSEGKLETSHRITEYMPDLPVHYGGVTVAQLISHSAGVRHYKKNEWMKVSVTACKTARDAIGVFVNDPLEFEPGKGYSYSSFGYVLLSAMIETITQRPFDEYVRAEILLPAGVSDIALDKTADAESGQTAYYEKWNKQSAKAKGADEVNNSCKFGGGGFVGTASALVRLHLAMLNGKIVSGDALAQYYSSFSRNDGQLVNYGFGIGVAESNGMKYHAHTGSALGASSVMIIYPKEKVVVVVLGNLNDDAMNDVAGKLARLFF